MIDVVFIETREKSASAVEFLKLAFKKYGPNKIILGNSFGKDSLVVYHLARQVNPNIACFTVLTDYKPKETIDLINEVSEKWGVSVIGPEQKFPIKKIGKEPFIKLYKYLEEKPDKEYMKDPNACCKRLKVIPTFSALKETKVKAWITGLRRTEGKTRESFAPLEKYTNNIDKINPLVGGSGLGMKLFDWDELDIWKYTATNTIPTNKLYLEGYRSIGCLPCSGVGGEEERSMRWKNTSKCGGECGIHTSNKPGSPLNALMTEEFN